MPSVDAVELASGRVPPPPDTPATGGGAITFEPRVVPALWRAPCGLPAPLALTAGGGGTTFAASAVPELSRELFVFTAGGGGTTSDAPKTLSIIRLTNDPLPAGVGGGGTTDFEESGTLPPER
jgi:hypothetical protein